MIVLLKVTYGNQFIQFKSGVTLNIYVGPTPLFFKWYSPKNVLPASLIVLSWHIGTRLSNACTVTPLNVKRIDINKPTDRPNIFFLNELSNSFPFSMLKIVTTFACNKGTTSNDLTEGR